MNPWWIRDNLPQIQHSLIKRLWYCDFYDIDLTGILLYEQKPYWYELFEDDSDDFNALSLYLIRELSEEQFVDEKRWHTLFRAHVGHHTDFEEDGVPYLKRIHKDSNPDLFYKECQSYERPDYSKNKIIGWYQTEFQAKFRQE